MLDKIKRLLTLLGNPSKLLAWLNDPVHPGRKRGVAAVLFIVAEGLRGIGTGFQKACAAALLSGPVCALKFASWASWVDTARQIVSDYAVPGLEWSAVLMGVWGLIHARKRPEIVTVRDLPNEPTRLAVRPPATV